MVREIRTCDICGEQIEDGRYCEVKMRSSLFVNYCNYDIIGADKRTIDVCEDCTILFGRFVEDMKRQSKKEGEEHGCGTE